jgi:hypothetical protein
MAHLVPFPPPPVHHVPSITRFSIPATYAGIGYICAWGCSPANVWRVGTSRWDEVVSTPVAPAPAPDLMQFELRGARKGQKIALWIRNGAEWVRYSEFVDVDTNLADSYESLPKGRLPKSASCSEISLYPFGSLQGTPALSEVEWMAKVEAVLRKISSNVVGRAVLRNLRGVTIYPYVANAANAWSDILYNPAFWERSTAPSCSPDEILLHELIHRVERDADYYQDRYGFMFDGSDFLTINATNVYSCLNGRALRKDHHGMQYLPDEHFRNPKLHYEQQRTNYLLAARSIDLVGALSGVTGVWNPFRYWGEEALRPTMFPGFLVN